MKGDILMALVPPLSQHDATIIAAGAITSYNRACKVVPLTTQKYTGEILGQGSTVKVVKLADVALADYDPAKGLTYGKLAESNVMLTVDQAKSFAFSVDDTAVRAGAGSYIAAASDRAGRVVAETVDAFVAGVWAAGAGKVLPDAALADAGAAYEAILSIRTALADTGSHISVIVPSAVYAKLLADNRFVGAGTDGTVLRNGFVGMAAGVSIYEGNSIAPATGKYTILATSDENAIATAMTINKVQVVAREAFFDQAVKGLAVYGAKVIRSEAVAKLLVTL
jgi:hypothetical protein